MDFITSSWLTGAVIVWSMIIAYKTTRDPLHPLIYMGPMMGFIYFYYPVILDHRDLLERFFPDESKLAMVQTFNLICVAAFCVGCLKPKLPVRAKGIRMRVLNMSPQVRDRIFYLALVLGLCGVSAYLFSIYNVGGFRVAYSHAKGGGWAPSGYIGEAPLLTIPAVFLLLASWRGKRINWVCIALVVLFAFPHLMRGFLGARRGYMFMSLGMLMLPWWFVSRKRPSFWVTIAALSVVTIMMVFVWSQRKQVYIGSDFEFDKNAMVERMAPSEIDTGHEYIFSSGQILNAIYHKQCYWGRRYMVILFIRPIPKQLWPTKYEDVGMENFAKGHSSYENEEDWKESVGWVPLFGAAHGLIADMFLEFSWGGVIACYLVGLLLGSLWRNAVVRGGIWNLLYVEAGVLSIYIPTQSFSAWMHRFLFMSIPTWILWHRYVVRQAGKPTLVKRARPTPTLPISNSED